jgi:chromosome partitioning protein
MYDARTNLSQDVVANVRETLDVTVYDTLIPRNVRLAEAPSYGLPAIEYDPRSAGAIAYMNLAREVIRRIKK